MESQRQQKQQFLRQQIINSGIDPQSFMKFMTDYKNKEINIDDWTMKQLQEVVIQYKKSLTQQEPIQSEQVPPILQNRKTKQMITSQIKQHKQQKTKVKYTIFGKNNLEDFELITKQQCKKIDPKIFIPPKSTLAIKSQAYQIKKQGGTFLGFGTSYQLHILISNNLNDIKVVRKSQDFDWLRTALIKRYPGSYIPALRAERSIQPQDENSIKSRVSEVISFINKIAYFDYLIHNKIFTDFLFEKQSSKFNSLKNKQKQTQAISDISKIQNSQGFYTVQISNRLLSFVKGASNYGKKCQQNYGAIQYQLNKVLADMENLSKNLMKISKQCFNLTQNYQNMTKQCELSGQLKSIFKYLNTLFATAANGTRNQMLSIKQVYDGFLKDVKNEWQTFSNFDKKRQYQFQKYLDEKQNLIKRKQKYISEPMKWQLPVAQYQRVMKSFNPQQAEKRKEEYMEIMMPRQTENDQCQKIWFAYCNAMFEKSFVNLMKMLQNSHIQNIRIATQKVKRGSKEGQDLYQRFQHLYCKK